MNKATNHKKTLAVSIAEPIEGEPLLSLKTDLATQGIDAVMFRGQVGSMVASMGAMMGISQVSISLLFPTKKPANMRPFLVSLNSIINTALDDQVDLPDFTVKLAEAIQEIRRIAEEER